MLRRCSLLLALVSIASVACGSGSTAGAGGATGSATGSSVGASSGSGTTAAAGTSAGTSGADAAAGATTGTSVATGMTSGTSGATTGTATAGGSGAGSTGTAGMGDGGSTVVAGKSAGCNQPTTELPSKWNQHNIMVTAVASAYAAKFTSRIYWTRPPVSYDNTKPYSLFIWGQGCGQGPTAESIPPSENPEVAGAAATLTTPTIPGNAVVVELLASQGQQNHCYSAGPDGDNADSPEIPYFDQVLSEVEAAYCIDKSKVFIGGYSSGGWESALMSCVRTNVLRGTGWAAAGLQLNHPACVGPVAALITRGMADPGTPLDQTMQAIESIRTRNGCAATTKPWTPTWNAGEEQADTSSCVSYDGCMPGYPLVWCPTPGAHTNTESDTHLTRDGLWKLWSTLP